MTDIPPEVLERVAKIVVAVSPDQPLWALPHLEPSWPTVTYVPASRLAEAEQEIERLRERTHEIAEERDRELADLRSFKARMENDYERAREQVKGITADWTTDPPSQEPYGLWRYCSENTKVALCMLAGRAEEAEAQIRFLAKELSWEPGHVPDPRTGDEERPADLALRLLQEYHAEKESAEALAARYRAALEWLVKLKDGPRDGFYETEKPMAWEQAREALSRPPIARPRSSRS